MCAFTLVKPLLFSSPSKVSPASAQIEKLSEWYNVCALTLIKTSVDSLSVYNCQMKLTLLYEILNSNKSKKSVI